LEIKLNKTLNNSCR